MRVINSTTPAEPGDLYHLFYTEAVEGKRHGYKTKVGVMIWTRSPNHPADDRCPECAGQKEDTVEESKKAKHLTDGDLQALPVDTLVYSRYGKEYRVDLWANHNEDYAGMGKMLVAVEDGGGLGTVTFTNLYGPGTLTPPEDVELTTPAELQALPVGTSVYDEDGREYKVELWEDHGGNEGDGRVLVAPGHKSGTEAFLSTNRAYLQRPAAVVQREAAEARYGVRRGDLGGEAYYVYGEAESVFGVVDLDAVDYNRAMAAEPDRRRRVYKTELWESANEADRDELAAAWAHKRLLLVERFVPAWGVTGGWPEAGK